MKELREMTYDQLVEYSEQIYTELKRRIRAQAKANIRKMLEPKETPLETKVRLKRIFRENQQDKRDRIVEQAKKDVEELTLDAQLNILRPKFVINSEKRTVVCLLERFDLGYIRAKGIAKCAPGDCFNVHIGKAIALRRALGLEVPAEYLSAPAPTEVRVGDVIEYRIEGEECPSKLTVVADGTRLRINETCAFTSIAAKNGEIIDDSRESEAK